MNLDFSRAGVKGAVVEFFFSIVKTAVAAVVVYVGVKLNNLNVSHFVKPEYAIYGTLFIAGVRALLTSIGVWATTSSTATQDATAPIASEQLV